MTTLYHIATPWRLFWGLSQTMIPLILGWINKKSTYNILKRKYMGAYCLKRIDVNLHFQTTLPSSHKLSLVGGWVSTIPTLAFQPLLISQFEHCHWLMHINIIRSLSDLERIQACRVRGWRSFYTPLSMYRRSIPQLHVTAVRQANPIFSKRHVASEKQTNLAKLSTKWKYKKIYQKM